MGFEILITNDDGYTSKGINTLAHLASRYGNVTVVAPVNGQSGMSVALTLDRPLRLHKAAQQEVENGHTINIYTLTGTPADCVKMAMNQFYTEKKPDLLISGINHGSNASVASVYSGTLGACIEGTIYGIPSIGLSIDNHNPDADFSIVETHLDSILKNYLHNPPKPGIYLNINFPAIAAAEAKGIRFASQGRGMWIKEFTERTDPHGRNYYWMTGEFMDGEHTPVADHTLLRQGYITIVPHKVDNTDYEQLSELSAKWKFDLDK